MPHYAKNSEILACIKSYRENGDKKSYERLGQIFINIASNFLNRLNTINYTKDRKDAMISDATYLMLVKMGNFDPEKSNNPFSFFTSIAKNAISKAFNEQKRIDKKFVTVSFVENMNSDGSE